MAFDKSVLAANVRAHRAAMDITQDELAKLCGSSKSSVFAWEDGSRTIQADKLFALAEVFGCTPNDLLGWK